MDPTHPYNNYFITENNIPDDYIRFSVLKSRILSSKYISGKPLYLGIDESTGTKYSYYNTLSKVVLQQYNNDNELFNVAYFYERYRYTKGLKEILEEKNNLNFFKIKIETPIFDTDGERFDINFVVYIEKKYLLHLYELPYLPSLIYNIILDSQYNEDNDVLDEIKKISNKQIDIYNHNFKKDYYRQLFTHQKNNIQKMINLENKIKNDLIKISTYNSRGYDTYTIQSINEKLLYKREFNSNTLKILDQTQFKSDITLKPRGGFLSDEIGLGKTFSILGLIYEQTTKKTLPSLIICPKRLCMQWDEEIKKSCQLKSKIIATITQFKKLNQDNIKEFDLIILSYHFLTSKSYLEYINKNSDSFSLHNFIWERVILDEAHEYFNIKNTKHILTTRNYLYKIPSKFRWICSGTPFSNYYELFKCLSYISNIDMLKINCQEDGKIKDNILVNDFINIKSLFNDDGLPYFNNYQGEVVSNFLKKKKNINILADKGKNRYQKYIWDTKQKCFNITTTKGDIHQADFEILNYNYIKHIIPLFIEEILIKNTKDSVKDEIQIPSPEIFTEFLTQTTIERAIYQSALGNRDKMIQLCNHIQVSDDHINILDNKPLSLNEIHNKMVLYYENKIIRIEKRLSNLKENQDTIDSNLLEKHIEKINDLENYLANAKSVIKIFEGIDNKIKEESTCPICLENYEQENLIKAITPCGHFTCTNCMITLSANKNKITCPMCRNDFVKTKLEIIKPEKIILTNKYGTKLSKLRDYCQEILQNDLSNRMIIFSQWDNMLKLVSNVLDEIGIKYLIINGSMYHINNKLRKFKIDTDIRIVLLSMEKASSGLNLTSANHIVLLDSLNADKETSQTIEQQAIGRAVRIGQSKKVIVKRLIMKDTIEEEFYNENV